MAFRASKGLFIGPGVLIEGIWKRIEKNLFLLPDLLSIFVTLCSWADPSSIIRQTCTIVHLTPLNLLLTCPHKISLRNWSIDLETLQANHEK